MAIEALPQTTVHLLGSAQALTTPTSLVKELIDNSIDAHATSIDILISPNTLDKIDVRDNGHGIAAEDLDHLGRRGHTSKLRTFEDLKSIGGVSLGFRGEALASAVQLGDVSVTTRTDGEPVANSVKIKAPGGIASQSRCSHPVGTTVSVANFMFKIPVRKQVFVKEATKTLAKIKELLQAYSLARPNLRFSLKVTKGGKGSWSFAPRPNNGIREAVAQVINRDLAVICIEKYLAFSRHQNSSRYGVETGDSQENLSEKFEVEVFLPKSGIDVSKIGFGQFISIDSRPVAHDKGTMRKIVTLFKYYVKGIGSDDFQRLKNPFLRMNIKCPRESYDPNVEPAKDDVLFENESYILETIERLFKDVYGDPKLASPTIVSRTPLHNADDFELLLARTPAANHDPAFEPRSFDGSEAQNQHLLPVCEMTPDATAGKEQETTIAGLNDEREPEMRSSTQRRWNMSKGYSEDVEEDSQRKPIQWDRGSTSAPSPCSEPFATLNPWLIAKMNRPVRETDTTAQSNLPGPKNNTNIHIANDTGLLPTPQNSSSPMAAGPGLREPPMQTFQARQARLEEDIRARSIANVFQVLEQRQNMPRGDSLIDQAPAKRRRSVDDDQDRESMFRVHRRSQSAQSDADMLLVGDDSEIFIRPNDFISARLAPPPDSSMVSAAPRLRKQRVLNKPFVSPLRTVENPASLGNLRQDNRRQATLTGGYSPVSTASRHQPVCIFCYSSLASNKYPLSSLSIPHQHKLCAKKKTRMYQDQMKMLNGRWITRIGRTT